MVADATGNVFIAGDVGVQASGWAGNIYVFTPAGAGAAANAWTQLVDQTGVVGTVRPHADSRDLLLDPTGAAGSPIAAFGELWNANDGGVYKLNLGSGVWSDMNGDATTGLRITELLSTAYDALNAIIIGGSQDNGVEIQGTGGSDGLDSNANGLIDDAAERAVWQSLITGDGNTLAVIPVDAIADPAHKLDHVLYYVMLNTVDLFYVIYVDNNRSNFIWTAPALKSSSDHGLVLSGVNTTTGVWTTATPNPLLTGGGPYLFRNDAGSVLPGGVNPGSRKT